jgi:hypothetical protein
VRHELDKDEWIFFGDKEPLELQVCWVRLFECHGDEILQDSYHLGLYTNNTFIDEDGYPIGDGSGTEFYQWKPCISRFQLDFWNEDRKVKATLSWVVTSMVYKFKWRINNE